MRLIILIEYPRIRLIDILKVKIIVIGSISPPTWNPYLLTQKMVVTTTQSTTKVIVEANAKSVIKPLKCDRKSISAPVLRGIKVISIPLLFS